MGCWNKIPALTHPPSPPSWPSANGRWYATSFTELVTLVPAEQAEALLADLADWGQVTTIVESDGSILR